VDSRSTDHNDDGDGIGFSQMYGTTLPKNPNASFLKQPSSGPFLYCPSRARPEIRWSRRAGRTKDHVAQFILMVALPAVTPRRCCRGNPGYPGASREIVAALTL
jgi:hypothetical protein